jgi:hypothetical protein
MNCSTSAHVRDQATLEVTVKNTGLTRLPGARLFAVVQQGHRVVVPQRLTPESQRLVIEPAAEQTVTYAVDVKRGRKLQWLAIVRDSKRGHADSLEDRGVCETEINR